MIPTALLLIVIVAIMSERGECGSSSTTSLGDNNNNSGGDEEVYINTQDGFIRNINAGLQYSNKWNDKHNFNFSPKYNLQDYSNVNTNKTITQLGDSTLNQNSSSTNNTYRYNIKNSLTFLGS